VKRSNFFFILFILFFQKALACDPAFIPNISDTLESDINPLSCSDIPIDQRTSGREDSTYYFETLILLNTTCRHNFAKGVIKSTKDLGSSAIQLSKKIAPYLNPVTGKYLLALSAQKKAKQAYQLSVLLRNEEVMKQLFIRFAEMLEEAATKSVHNFNCMSPLAKANLLCKSLGYISTDIIIGFLTGGVSKAVTVGRLAEILNTISTKSGKLKEALLLAKLNKKKVKVAKCSPGDCAIEGISVDQSDLKHLSVHFSDTDGLESLFSHNTDFLKAINQNGNLNRKQKIKEIKSILENPPFRGDKPNALFPKGVKPDDILAEIQEKGLKRFSRNDHSSSYSVDYKGNRYTLHVCRRPPCMRDSQLLEGQDRLLSIYPDCGPGIKKLASSHSAAKKVYAALRDGVEINEDVVIENKACH